MIDDKTEELKKDLQKEKEEKQKTKKDDDAWSSGIESDNDFDLLVEQEVLQAIKIRKALKAQIPESAKEVAPKKQLTKEQSFEIWENILQDVPEDYDFVIKSQNDTFHKGSQVYLCYGRMSNRDALKRYGFCLTQNKYNNMCIKLRLE